MIKWSGITEKFLNEFDSVTKERGEFYFRNGLVLIENINGSSVDATVRGGRNYKIKITRPESGNVTFYCNCPFFLDWGRNCKHIWAVLKETQSYIENAETGHFAAMISDKKADDFSRVRTWRTILSLTDQKQEQKEFRPCFIIERSGGAKTLVIHIEERSALDPRKKKRLTLGRAKALRQEEGISEAHRLAINLIMVVNASRTGLSEDSFIDEFFMPWGTSLPMFRTFAETGDFYYRDNAGEFPLYIDETETPAFEIRILPFSEASCKAEIVFIPGGTAVTVKEIHMMILDNPCWFIYQGVLYPLDSRITHDFLDLFRTGTTVVVNNQELIEFLEACENRFGSAMSNVILPDGTVLEKISDVIPQTELYLSFDKKTTGRLTFRYSDRFHVGMHSGLDQLTDFNLMKRITRNFPEEKRMTDILKKSGFTEHYIGGEPVFTFRHDQYDLFETIDLLSSHGFGIYGQEGRQIRSSSAFNFHVSSGIDWFDLEGNLVFENNTSVSINALVDMWRNNERFVLLNDGSIGAIPESWLAKHSFGIDLARKNAKKGSPLRFTRSQAGLLDYMLESESPGNVTADPRFNELRQKLKNTEGILTVTISPRFKGKLRPYQQSGVNWLAFLGKFGFGGCLADDMGLGKTVQVLVILQHEADNNVNVPSMVVVPTSLVSNWQNEIRKFTPNLRFHTYTGLKKTRNIDEFHNHDLIITTYGILRKDIDILSKFEFNYVILDESQIIKNPDTQIAQAAYMLKANKRISMTGTPVENNLGELWSQFEFLNPGHLGSYNEFMKFCPSCTEEELKPLKRLTYPFIMRRMKEDVELELPPKMEEIIYCDMTARQRVLYGQIKNSLKNDITRSGKISRIKVLAGLLRLRQICCHPSLLPNMDKWDNNESGKFVLFCDMLAEIIQEGHKALIFSQFTSMLAILRNWMDQKGIPYQYLDGKTKDREGRVREFQENDECSAFLISLKAGGVGLNLTAADYVFIYDPWWNPAVETQAIDRTHRIGQTKRVISYRLIAKDSVEEKIVTLQQSKKNLSNIITTDENMLTKLSTEDLLSLFS